MFRWIEYILDRIFAALFALIFLQIPGFVNQYTQQLSGHTAELQYQVEQLRLNGVKSSMTLEQLIGKLLVSSDQDVAQQGFFLQQLVQREEHMSQSLEALINSSPYFRPFQLFGYLDWTIARETWQKFSFSVPLSLDALLFALIGLIIGFGIFSALRKLLYSLMCLLISPFRRKKRVVVTEKNKSPPNEVVEAKIVEISQEKNKSVNSSYLN